MAIDNNPPVWLSLLLFLPLFLFLYRIATQKKQLLPPSPPKLPIFGNLHQIGKLPHQSLWQLSKKYGPVMLLHLGRIPAVVISSAEAAREVLKTHDLACCSRPPLAGTGKLSYNYRDIGFAPYGDSWRNMRKIIVLELFSSKRVEYFRFIREGEVGFLISSISESSSSAAPVNLTEKLYALTANIVFRMAFGFNYRGTNFDKDRFHEVVHEAEAVAGSLSAEEYLPYFGWIIDWLTGHRARTERVFRELDNFFQHVIDDHLKPERKKEHDDMIDVFLRIIEKEQAELGASQFNTDNIKAVLVNVFLGGIDTASITVNWAMAELLKNPRLMKRAQDEVRGCVGLTKGRVTEDDIDQLEFLKMVVKETLRLHPPGPLLLPREVLSHCTINGENLYPKMMLYINAWAIGRDPMYWKDPEEFFPERFVDNSVDFRGQNFEFLPFGAGRRICPALQLGIVTVEIILANLLYCFDWKLPSSMNPEDINMEEKTGVSLAVSKDIDLHLVPVSFRK